MLLETIEIDFDGGNSIQEILSDSKMPPRIDLPTNISGFCN